jgi:hypothetical protein
MNVMMNALVDIFDIAAVSVTTIVLVSLRFVAVLDERDRAEANANSGPVKLEPFQLIEEESVCPKCGARWRSFFDVEHPWVKLGPRIGHCSARKCEAAGLSYLHMSCDACNSRWLMATKDTPSSPPTNEPP